MNSLVLTIADLTPEEAAVGGLFLGMGLTLSVVMGLVWFLLRVIADWKIFQKAGEAGWKAIVPVLNVYTEYGICWTGLMGILYMVCTVCSTVLSPTDATTLTMEPKTVAALAFAAVALIIHITESAKLAKSFGKGIGYTLLLIFIPPLGRILLGFGDAVYMDGE